MRSGKLFAVLALVVGLSLLNAVSATASTEKTSKPLAETRNTAGEVIAASGDVLYTRQATPGDTIWIQVHDDTRCDSTGNPEDGGQGTGAPGWATWCWEGGLLAPGAYDSCSSTIAYGAGRPGCFDHYDIYRLLTNQWHLDTFKRYLPASQDSTPWCGEYGDPLVWKNPDGYGPDYYFSLILNLGKADSAFNFNAALGYTIGGVHMYDCEINCDYCYLEYALSNDVNSAIWLELARYNGTCNADVGCPDASGGADYGCAQYEAFNVIGPPANNLTEDLLIRWRFASDKAWDDEDANGGVHTDGAWRIDEIEVRPVDPASIPYGPQDFEGGMPPEWTTPNLPKAQIGGYWSGDKWVNGIPIWCDWWHLELDPDYANYGNTSEYSNNWMWVADDKAYSQNQEDAYHYRLVSPIFECGDYNQYWDPDGTGPGPDNRWSGVITESDEYLCLRDIVGDTADVRARVYDSSIQRWSHWEDGHSPIADEEWHIDIKRDWSYLLSENIDSIQFSWEFWDKCNYNSAVEIPCMGQHHKATYLIDNVSIGVYETESIYWTQGASERFADTYARNEDMHSLFRENWEFPPATVPWQSEDSLAIHVRDYDGLMGNSVRIHWRISTDCGSMWDKEPGRPQGATYYPIEDWNLKNMNFSEPDNPQAQGTKQEHDGVYRTRLTRAECGFDTPLNTLWPEGTVIEYYFTAMDSMLNRDTFPNRNDFIHNSLDLVETTPGKEHDRREPWPLYVQVLPCPPSKRPLPPGQNHRVLLVDSYGRRSYDIEADINFLQEGLTVLPMTYQIYQESLDRLGVQYDFYRSGYGARRDSVTGIDSQPWDMDGDGGVLTGDDWRLRYNTVIWFFGDFSSLTVLEPSLNGVVHYILCSPDSGSLWLVGDDLCEDEKLSDFHEAPSNAFLWRVLAGLDTVTGGCPDDDGHSAEGDILAWNYPWHDMMVCGYWGSPTYRHPDLVTKDSATPIMKFMTYTDPEDLCYSLKRHGNGSKMIVSFAGLELLTSSPARDCLTLKVLSRFDTGIPDPLPWDYCFFFDETAVQGGAPASDRLVLYSNRPNPFNPTTKIRFSLPAKSKVSLRIYDIAGREIRTLVDEVLDASGNHTATWHGKDNSDRDVASGVYFCRLSTDMETAIKKMVLLR